LAAEADASVVVIQAGFSTNLAALLTTSPDRPSPLDGRALVARKVQRLSLMVGSFVAIAGPDGRRGPHPEYNAAVDVPAAQGVARQWPVEAVWSGYEVGLALPFPHQSIDRDYAYGDRHPVAEAYRLHSPPPHDRPCWDLTSVLHAVRPEAGYFRLSSPGAAEVADDGLTTFTAATGGRRRLLVLDDAQQARVLEALQLLCSQPSAPRADRRAQEP
jgi:hypothetical protein